MAKGTKRPHNKKSGDARAKRQKKPAATASTGANPTVKDILNDRLTPLANAYWALGQKSLRPYDPQVVERVYGAELSGADPKEVSARAVLLEFSSYLENYLWRHFDAKRATPGHVLSVMMMVNEKFREGVPVWDIFHAENEGSIGPFFGRVFSLRAARDLTPLEKITHVHFLINCYSSLEDPDVRSCCTRYVSLPMWRHVSRARVQGLLQGAPRLSAAWKALSKAKRAKRAEADFFPELIKDFLASLDQESPDALHLRYLERCMELFVDLLSRLPTRKFLRPVLVDCHFVVRCKLSRIFGDERGKLLRQLLQMINFYEDFGIDDREGKALTEKEIEIRRHERIERLQGLAFKHFRKELESVVLGTVSSMDTREGILKHLEKLTAPRLRELCERVHILGSRGDSPLLEVPDSKPFLAEVFVNSFEKRRSQRQEVNALPLYPSESVLWDTNLVPELTYHGDEVLALPKLNLQFLTIYDYLLRNFNLFRLESTYEIREDLKNVVHRLKPRQAGNGETVFTGWAKMAVPVRQFGITKVQKPNIGEVKPALVQAEVTVDLAPFQTSVRADWENIREHDVLFLLCVEARHGLEEKVKKLSLKEQLDPAELGIKYVRGCEVRRVLDEEKHVIGERRKDGTVAVGVGDMRTFRVELDTAQYQQDMTAVVDGADDVYTTFNLLVKRKAKENNFKAVLETIRNLMKGQFVIPEWLHNIFLGYGDPGSATYKSVASPTWRLRFSDTFLDFEHLRSCFAGHTVTLDAGAQGGGEAPGAPYEIEFLDQKKMVEELEAAGEEDKGQDVKRASRRASKKKPGAGAGPNPELLVKPYAFETPGPYPEDQPKRNTIRFTGKQVEAIRSGLNHGLTMIVGPPGTGKTDVAVQVMAELFHNEPKQRTLLVTHSNHALNDLFEKIMARDIDERYLLRCGRGEEELKTEKDFSKFGRVNYMLERRLHCLGEVSRLAVSLGLPDDSAYTCETASHFYLQYVLSRWEVFVAQWDQFKLDGTRPPEPEPRRPRANGKQNGAAGQDDVEEMDEEEEEEKRKKEEAEAAARAAAEAAAMATQRKLGFVEAYFPFRGFFANAPNTVFTGNDETDIGKAWGCWRHLKNLFKELEECRPFEILRNYRDRGNYLISKHAKVIAMTCTHAAIRRGEFVNLHMQYDNLIMEEAAQILEIETFIPMLLQEHDREFGCRLKRVVLLGDHHQLPPIIKNMAFQKYSHMDQSLFARFIRIGVPHIQLNAQGRSRPSIAKLWNWRYEQLGDLPHVMEGNMYLNANSGFSYEYQFVNVEDFEGKGCTTPMPYFYQNLAEAEYVVQVYMYMRLLGYPANTISMLTTYNGQKALLEDIVKMRCSGNPFYGRPGRISTVDKYQGQQNDYVLLSLVRSNTPGHIRDVRRLVVAMSRARLGLYVFGRENLFKNCFELAPTFSQLLARPTKLSLNLEELSSLTTRKMDKTGKTFEVKDMPHMGQIVAQMAQRAQQNVVQRHYAIQQAEDQQNKEAAEAQRQLIEAKKKEFAQMEMEAEAQENEEESAPASKVDESVAPVETVPQAEDAMDTEAPTEVETKSSSAKEVPNAAAAAAVASSEAANVEAAAPEPEAKELPQEPETEEPAPEITPEPAESVPDYKSMKFRELQKECKRLGLKASGKKAELLARLLASGK